MNSVYLVCYGTSEENVNISFEKKIIGSSNHAKIPTGQLIYLIVKRDGEWTVVGNATIGKETSDNPFKKPNRFKTYTIENVKKCAPFSVSAVCKRELGERYGLVLRSPQPIYAENFIKFLAESFV